MSVQWKDSFRIGIKLVDDQHRELFSRLDKLEDALREGKGREVVISTFHFLDNYVNLHFWAEEDLQRRYRYPHQEMHAAEHAVFIKRLKLLEEQLAVDEPSEQLAAHTRSFLTQWLISHVTSLDRELKGYFDEARTEEWEKWVLAQI